MYLVEVPGMYDTRYLYTPEYTYAVKCASVLRPSLEQSLREQEQRYVHMYEYDMNIYV